jgi:hypothetical protein
MQLTHRPLDVRTLLDDPTYTQRVLDRVQAVQGLGLDQGFPVLDLLTRGCLLVAILKAVYVVRICDGDSLVARVQRAAATDAACRLLLDRWCSFVNNDPTLQQLQPGVYLFLGPAWRHVPAHCPLGQ